VSTEPTDPIDPIDPNPANISQADASVDRIPPESSRIEPDGSGLPDDVELGPDGAQTEEVEVRRVKPALSSLGPITSDSDVEQEGESTAPSGERPQRISMGRLLGLSMMVGTALSVLLGLPICGDLGRMLLPPVVGGILIAVLASRWEGPAALNPTHVGMAGATVGVMLGTVVSIGIGFTLWLQRDDLLPQLQEAAQGQMSAMQVLMLGVACMLPFMQCLYAALGLMSARWMLARLLPRADA
jgi:hypothetical protein